MERAEVDEQLVVARHVAGTQPRIRRHRRHDREVQLLARDAIGQHGAVGLDDLQVHVGMRGRVLGHGGRERGPRERRHQAGRHGAGLLALHRPHLDARLVEFAEQLQRMGVETLPGGRRLDAPGGALEQLQAERILELLDLHRQPGLGRVDPFGRRGERAFLVDHDEGRYLLQLHGTSSGKLMAKMKITGFRAMFHDL